jgi:transcription elongation GreA/GreB family factor
VGVTALVTLEDDETGARTHYFLVPRGGGERLEVDGAVIRSLTPVSPLGRRLMGRGIGDEVELERPRGALRATLVALR